MQKTPIAWTKVPGYEGYSWNPVTGCTKVSSGCNACYAHELHNRFHKGEPFTVTLHPDRLSEPSRLRKPAAIFVCSMSDLFHEAVPGRFINDFWMRMFNNDRHLFLLLTKRPERMLAWTRAKSQATAWPIEDVWPPWAWLGVTIENRAVKHRIETLRAIPAAVRFLSCEPLLEDLQLTPADLRGIDWVIVGGESGRGARACDIRWIWNIREACQAANVPFFFKQYGANNNRRDYHYALTPGIEDRQWPHRAEVPRG